VSSQITVNCGDITIICSVTCFRNHNIIVISFAFLLFSDCTYIKYVIPLCDLWVKESRERRDSLLVLVATRHQFTETGETETLKAGVTIRMEVIS
jgi:hypothetical protein